MGETIQFIPTCHAEVALQKYGQRGWIVVPTSSVGGGLHPANELVRDRVVGDGASWVVTLHGASMSPDTTSSEYKWLRAHSWSHLYHQNSRRIRIVALPGVRCGWKWSLTYALVGKHLIMHDKPRKPTCDLCAEQVLQPSDAYISIQNVVRSTPRISRSGLDQGIVRFLRSFFHRLPFQGPLHWDYMPDSETAFALFRHIRGLLMYYRIKPQITLAFQEQLDTGSIGVRMEVFIPEVRGMESKSLAFIHPVRGRCSSLEGLDVLINVGVVKPITAVFSDHYVFGTYFPAMNSPTQLSKIKLPHQERVILDEFIRTLFLSSAFRRPGAIPIPECKKQLLQCLTATFLLLDCSPKLHALFLDKGDRTDISVFTVITVTLPEEWPDLDQTLFAVTYNADIVRTLQLLGFSVHIVKGGRSFM
ncbi:hypothetical protein AAF712_013003 [Marasmius tenuissimus]|uniref:Uncharacterized protein n=1 Tax=Marasmius tenuissimus TaxID=585030 RepID=A0ABR2ZG46_9AGAR